MIKYFLPQHVDLLKLIVQRVLIYFLSCYSRTLTKVTPVIWSTGFVNAFILIQYCFYSNNSFATTCIDVCACFSVIWIVSWKSVTINGSKYDSKLKIVIVGKLLWSKRNKTLIWKNLSSVWASHHASIDYWPILSCPMLYNIM